jgi:carboxymethylenebutenolidase
VGEWVQVGPNNNRAYLAVPESGIGAGVLVLHAWWGLTSVFTDVCDRLAADGFVALAPGLYPSGETTDSIPEAEALVNKLFSNQDATEIAVLAAVDHLRGLPAVTDNPIGLVGYSLGASWALDLSITRTDDVGAVVVVYGTGGGDFSGARAAYQGHFAENDDFEPLEEVRALEAGIRAAGRDVEFHVYPGTGHWFVEPNRPDVYNAEAAALVWDRTLAFLQARLGG